jgi:hypothetical protein
MTAIRPTTSGGTVPAPRHPLSALLLLALAALTACSPGATVPEVDTIPADGPWTISVTLPEGDWSTCFDDAAVAESIMSASMPTSGASARLHDDATRGDVERLLACLDARLTSGTVTVGNH